MPRILLCATTTGYQLTSFREAAARLGYEVALATDRCHVMEDPWGDQAVAFRTGQIEGPVDGVVALGDRATTFAAEAAQRLGLRFHPPPAVAAAQDKAAARRLFRQAGLLAPQSQFVEAGAPGFPCVVKPVRRSGSQGVIRADSPTEFERAVQRVRRLVGDEPILAEEFIPGREFALEGLVKDGMLHPLTIFDKPDPLDGPFFDETIYLTPSREPAGIQDQIRSTVQRAARALGFTDGPIHAEMRVNAEGVWMLEAAARPIGGLCARVLPGLEEKILVHAVTGAIPAPFREPAGVMMIPVPREGIYQGIRGLEEARSVPGIAEIEITAVRGQHLRPLPEGASYFGFIFARGALLRPLGAESVESGIETRALLDRVEAALREAHQRLQIEWTAVLPVLASPASAEPFREEAGTV